MNKTLSTAKGNGQSGDAAPRTHVVKLMTGDQIELTAQQVTEIYTLKEAGKEAYISKKTGECIPLRPMPTIVSIERARATDKDKLARAGQYRCKYGQIHDRQDRCTCDHQTAIKEPFAPMIHASVRKKMVEVAGRQAHECIEAGAAATYEDHLEARAAYGDSRAKRISKS